MTRGHTDRNAQRPSEKYAKNPRVRRISMNARLGSTPTKKPGGHPGLLARAPLSGGLVQQRSFVPKNFLKIYDMQGPVFEHSDALQIVARPFEGLG